MSPNPATSTVAVEDVSYSSDKSSSAKSGNATGSIYKIWITDKTGNVILQFNYTSPLDKANINISELKPDTYFLKIYNGKSWTIKKLMKV